MNNVKPLSLAIVLSLVIGVVAGVFVAPHFRGNDITGSSDASGEAEPLYWVAPMDPNYKRDKPGKSPMGMDLIPVYENQGGEDEGPGTITISPNVVNNLGVRSGEVTRAVMQEKIVTVGYVQYDQDKLIHIHPRVSGWIETLYIKAAGDPVKAGQPVYDLYSPELVNAQEEFVLALNRDNSRFIEAARERLKALQVSDKFINTLQSNRLIQQTVTFYAPQEGVVDNLNIREGFFVQPGTTLMSIGALDEVWVEGEIFERQASLVKVGDHVTMALDYIPGKTWHGKVEYIYPTLDSKTRTARMRLSFENPDRKLKPNMYAQITVHTQSEEDMLLIPREALIRTGDQNRVVLDLGEGKFKSIAVKVGQINTEFAEIIEGLEEGERIVTSAQFLLDSESSKTSDFKRMHHEDERPESVWVEGEIQMTMPEERKVSVSHDAIEAWNMSAMTMNFNVDQSIDFETLSPGTVLHMELNYTEGEGYVITGTHIMKSGDSQDKSEHSGHGNMDHNQMDHENMNHEMMNHNEMNHEEMNHDMDHSDHHHMMESEE